VNQTREQVIRCCVHPLHDLWVQHQANVEFEITAVVFKSKTMSPYKVTLGFEPTCPSTATFDDIEPNRTSREQVKILVELHTFAHEFVKAAQVHMHESINRHRSPLPLRVGDKFKLKSANLRYNHVLNYATATLDYYFSLRKRFLRLRFGLSYPLEYGSTMLYMLAY
jgi:hypothetical protein